MLARIADAPAGTKGISLFATGGASGSGWPVRGCWPGPASPCRDAAAVDAATEQVVAAVVAFLASDAASFVTGAYYPVDGGYLAR